MYRDSLGNRYTRCINGRAAQPHKAKPSAGGTRKFDRNRPNSPRNTTNHWTRKVLFRGGRLD